jgi:hypothetical protein
MVSAKKLTGINPLAYLGVEPETPPNLVIQPFAPTPADSQNNNIGTIWIVPGNGGIFMLTALIGNVATWIQIYPASFTPLQFFTDAGIAIPAANAIQVFGGTNMNTAGVGNTVTINLDNNITVNNLTAQGSVVFSGLAATGVLQADLAGIVSASAGTDGQLLIGATAGNPAWANLASSDSSITITNGANTIDLTTTAAAGIHTLDADAGSATGATVTIAGGSNMNTSAAAATVTVNLDNTVSISGSMTAGTGFSATTGNVQIVAGNLTLPDTTATTGGILLGATLFVSNFGTANTFIGGAGNTTTAASNSVGVGSGALSSITLAASDHNVAVGWTAGESLTTGANNTLIGSAAGASIITGDDNVLVGESAGSAYAGAETNNIIIGSSITGVLGESNVIRIGEQGSSTSCLIGGIFGVTTGGTGTAVFVDNTGLLGTIVSSRRFKENITQMGAISEDIYKLKPIMYSLKADATHRRQPGLIAEEVAEVMPSLVIYDDNEKPYSVRYESLPTLLLNEIQKLHKRIQALEDKAGGN